MRIATTAKTDIHSGDNTHHQDQVIYPVSFRPTNRTVNKPAKPIPPLDEFDVFDILNLLS